MIRSPIHERYKIAATFASIAVVIAIYTVMCCWQKNVNPKDTTIPNVAQFVDGTQKLFKEDWLWEDLKATFGRHILGMAVGVVLSVVIGMAMGCFPLVERFFVIPISFMAKIPPTAMIAVYFVLFGTEMKMFVAMIALGILPTLAQAIYEAALNDVGEDEIFKAYTLGASNIEVIYNIVFQTILPRVIENVRLQVGPAMVFLIAAEWMMADVGFGYRLRIQSRLLNMNIVYEYLLILGATGYFMDWMLSSLRTRLCPWFGEGQ